MYNSGCVVKSDEDTFVGKITARFPFTPRLFAITFPCKNYIVSSRKTLNLTNEKNEINYYGIIISEGKLRIFINLACKQKVIGCVVVVVEV